MNNKTVSERLKYLRSINKKTQKEFAEFLGIPQPSMSAYENGKNNPDKQAPVSQFPQEHTE